MTTTLETLLPFARQVAQFPYDRNAFSNLVVRLQLVTEPEVCKSLIHAFPFHPEVAAPAWRRLIALVPDDARLLIAAGQAFYGIGLDEEAEACADKALQIDERQVPAWELKAQLCRSPAERIKIFTKIVDIEPNNRTAFDNLIMLRPPTDE